ncbi:hypothetical protein [Burkholderia ubonensis]|uniref:hypothetical protein n=1 Tax=Burkholderia ubonensis TaxID=101571 RepID=UPI000B319E6F|nr:hypothetical protein [Burkholderia ubonensis]
MPKISFVHTGFPTNCISPNILTEEGWEQYPRRLGTGFFVRREDKLYYLTARHCLTKDQKANIAKIAARLHIPFILQGSTRAADDYVEFSGAISLKHDSEDIPSELIDLIVLEVNMPQDGKKRKQILHRSVKLPPLGEWLDNFVNHSITKDALDKARGIVLSGIGYPYEGTETDISYPDGQPVEIVTQAAKFTGHLTLGSSPDRLMLEHVNWDEDLNGFSGSPVFVGFKSKHGNHYALARMLVTGGGGRIQFIKIGIITKSFQI